MHEYMRRILLGHETLDLKDGLYDVEVKHDDWCGVYKSRLCHCDPEITVRAPNGQLFRILQDGRVEQIILC